MAPTARPRRMHSPEFKAQVMQDCCEPGASIAGVALAHGVNANLVRRWLVKHGLRTPSRPDTSSPVSTAPVAPTGEFIPVIVHPAAAPAPTIDIEVRQGASTVTIHWPLQAAGDCAAWLRQWLR